jgi:hypothetical protein
MPWQISKHKPMPLPMSGFMNLLHEYWENMNEIFSKVRNFHCPQQSLRFSLSIRSPYCGPFYGSLNISQRKKCQQGTQPTQPRLFFTIGLHRVMVFCLYSVLFEAFYDLKGDWLNIGCKSVTLFLNICLSSEVQSAVMSRTLWSESSSYNSPTWHLKKNISTWKQCQTTRWQSNETCCGYKIDIFKLHVLATVTVLGFYHIPYSNVHSI